MTGAVMALAAAATAIAGTGTTVSPLPTWTSIYDQSPGFSNTQTITGITTTISVSASRTGTGTLLYQKNGTTYLYSGAFAVNAGDTLAWGILTSSSRASGVITVTNATTSTTLGTINYTVLNS